MPGIRKKINAVTEGAKHIARFRHPLRKNNDGKTFGKFIRVDLGDDLNWRANLQQLNRIFFDETLWHNPPPDTSKRVRDIWFGTEAKLKYRRNQGIVSKGEEETHANGDSLVRVMMERDAALRRIAELEKIVEDQGREIEHWSGKKLDKKSYATLREALDKFIEEYKGRDTDHTDTVKYDLEKFVSEFGPKTTVDTLEGREVQLSAWIRAKKNSKDQPLSGGRQKQIRLYILKMLAENGAVINRNAVTTAAKKKPVIRWLERFEADNLVKSLTSPWLEMFTIQSAITLRPDELLTLRRKNFSHDFSSLTLEPLNHLTLKNGHSRTIPIPSDLRTLIESRFKQVGDVLFPEPETGRPWANPKNFNRRYTYALNRAAMKAGFNRFKLDARIGRRTGISWLIQDGVSAEKVAKLAGNTPGMILEHYGDPDVKRLNLNKNVIWTENGISKESHIVS